MVTVGAGREEDRSKVELEAGCLPEAPSAAFRQVGGKDLLWTKGS